MTEHRSENLRRYDRRKAREELQSELWYPALGFGLGAVGFLVYGLRELGSLLSICSLAGAVAFAVLAYGFVGFRPWVRVPGGVLLAITGASGLVGMGFGDFEVLPFVGCLVYLGTAVYLFSGEARHTFERANPGG